MATLKFDFLVQQSRGPSDLVESGGGCVGLSSPSPDPRSPCDHAVWFNRWNTPLCCLASLACSASPLHFAEIPSVQTQFVQSGWFFSIRCWCPGNNLVTLTTPVSSKPKWTSPPDLWKIPGWKPLGTSIQILLSKQSEFWSQHLGWNNLLLLQARFQALQEYLKKSLTISFTYISPSGTSVVFVKKGWLFMPCCWLHQIMKNK